jgi:putative acetyltransferase
VSNVGFPPIPDAALRLYLAPMRVRSFHPADAPALAQLFFDAIHQIAHRHYSDDQVRVWAPEVPRPEQFITWASDGRLFLVAVNEKDEPLAFGDLQSDGHIDHLYCRPDIAGTGVTSIVYDALEAAAKEDGFTLIYVDASEPARRFFLRKGFRTDHRRDFLVGDVPIHNYRMEKLL